MARSDLVKGLRRSYTTGDDRTFRSTAEELILDERRKRHDLFAYEFEAILDEADPTRRPRQVSALRPLPKGRDDLDLLDIIQSRASLHDVILDPDTAAVVDGLLDEFRQRRGAPRPWPRTPCHAVVPRPPGESL